MTGVRRQRISVLAVFLVHGLLAATWIPHIPHFKEKLDMSEGVLGLVLLFPAIGAVTAMLLAGGIAAVVGADAVTRWTTVGFAVGLPLPFLAPTIPLFALSLIALGAVVGAMDVGMNAVATDIESQTGRPIMSAFHGMFSLGALGGSLIAAMLIAGGVDPVHQALGIAAVVLIGATPALRALDAPGKTIDERPKIRLPRGRLLTIGLVAGAVMLAEGSAADWGAVYLREHLGTSGSVAALGFGAFSLTMAIGRFTGDRINRHVGPVQLVRAGTALAAISLGLGILIQEPVAFIIAFGLMGLGLANVVPVVFTASARLAETPAQGISSTATISYLGFLAGPPIIGGIAELTNLAIGLFLVVGMIALASILAGKLGTKQAEHAQV